MNEKKDKKSKKPEYVSKNWKSSQGIRLLAMVLAIVSGFLVGVTSVVTVTLGMNSDLQGSQKDIEKTLDTELLRSYAYWMGDAVTGISKEQDEADALKKFDRLFTCKKQAEWKRNRTCLWKLHGYLFK